MGIICWTFFHNQEFGHQQKQEPELLIWWWFCNMLGWKCLEVLDTTDNGCWFIVHSHCPFPVMGAEAPMDEKWMGPHIQESPTLKLFLTFIYSSQTIHCNSILCTWSKLCWKQQTWQAQQIWKSQIMDTTQQMPIQVSILGLVKLENDSW